MHWYKLQLLLGLIWCIPAIVSKNKIIHQTDSWMVLALMRLCPRFVPRVKQIKGFRSSVMALNETELDLWSSTVCLNTDAKSSLWILWLYCTLYIKGFEFSYLGELSLKLFSSSSFLFCVEVVTQLNY